MSAMPAGWGFFNADSVARHFAPPDYSSVKAGLEDEVELHERIPTVDEIRDRYGVSRASAYRWRRMLQDRFTGRFS